MILFFLLCILQEKCLGFTNNLSEDVFNEQNDDMETLVMDLNQLAPWIKKWVTVESEVGKRICKLVTYQIEVNFQRLKFLVSLG